MESKLDLRTESKGNESVVYLQGRLDASGAGHLNDHLNNMIREGLFNIVLQMEDVKYLSSAGIRILVSQFKQLRKLGGNLNIESPSSAVTDILKMVGMAGMFAGSAAAAEDQTQTKEESLIVSGYKFSREHLGDDPMKVSITGDPSKSINSEFGSEDNVSIKFSYGRYGLGIGAIGDGYDDCKNRFGEFIGIGDAVIYKPSDGSKIPDYAVSSGKFEPQINVLAALLAEGSFSDKVFFEPAEKSHGINMSSLAEGLSQISGKASYVFLMIAESDGLVGISLNAPPVEGKKIFTWPEIKENTTFTTEPSYPRMLTVTLGFADDGSDGRMTSFLRPARPGSKMLIHSHTAVFPFQALPRNEASPGKLFLHLLETSIVQDVLHLLHDSREITGLGDSTFRHGIAWIGRLS
jgi:anti-anti-sigma factor